MYYILYFIETNYNFSTFPGFFPKNRRSWYKIQIQILFWSYATACFGYSRWIFLIRFDLRAKIQRKETVGPGVDPNCVAAGQRYLGSRNYFSATKPIWPVPLQKCDLLTALKDFDALSALPLWSLKVSKILPINWTPPQRYLTEVICKFVQYLLEEFFGSFFINVILAI